MEPAWNNSGRDDLCLRCASVLLVEQLKSGHLTPTVRLGPGHFHFSKVLPVLLIDSQDRDPAEGQQGVLRVPLKAVLRSPDFIFYVEGGSTGLKI